MPRSISTVTTKHHSVKVQDAPAAAVSSLDMIFNHCNTVNGHRYRTHKKQSLWKEKRAEGSGWGGGLEGRGAGGGGGGATKSGNPVVSARGTHFAGTRGALSDGGTATQQCLETPVGQSIA